MEGLSCKEENGQMEGPVIGEKPRRIHFGLHGEDLRHSWSHRHLRNHRCHGHPRSSRETFLAYLNAVFCPELQTGDVGELKMSARTNSGERAKEPRQRGTRKLNLGIFGEDLKS